MAHHAFHKRMAYWGHLFFVLSGFLLAYRYEDQPLESKKSYFKYILLRISRIFPLYWILLTLFFLDTLYSKDVHTYFLQYTLMYPLFDDYVLTGITQAWSLNVEFFFYLLAPLLFLLLKRKWQLCLAFLIILFGISVGVGYGLSFYKLNPHGFLYPVNFILSNTFWGRSLEFFIGMLLAISMKSKTNIFPKINKTLLGSILLIQSNIAIAVFARNNFVHGVERWEGRLIHETILPISIAILLWGLMTEKTVLSRLLSTRFLVLLGNASFVFYLIHISYFNLKLKTYIYIPDRNFVLLWACSILIYLLIEKPIYNLCRRGISKI